MGDPHFLCLDMILFTIQALTLIFYVGSLRLVYRPSSLVDNAINLGGLGAGPQI